MFFNDPAPYMDRNYIIPMECDQNTFQNPSLEVGLSAFAYSMMFYLAFDWVDVNRPRVKITDRNDIRTQEGESVFEDQQPGFFLSDDTTYQKTKADDFKFWLILALLIYLVFNIAYSAMYIGVNTFDQVLFAMTLGYGFFCIVYYYFRDAACESLLKSSEKMVPSSRVMLSCLGYSAMLAVAAIGIRIYYYYMTKGFTVNPKWKSNHLDDCGHLGFPSFFDKELFFAYKFVYLAIGVMVGIGFDSLVLGGTRVDYNQLRTSEDRNPTVGFILRLVITIAWVLLST
jgi:hypothetical protein